MKKAIIISLCLVFSLVVVASVVPFLIDLNKYKGKLLELVKPYLPRELDFDKIELTILTGLGAEIQGLRIGENPAFGKEDFVTLDRVHIKVKLFPLLKREIKVRKLILDRPVIQLVRNARGDFNFIDLAKGSGTVQPEETDEKRIKEKASGEKGGIFLAGFTISEFALLQGQIYFLDEMQLKGPVTRKVDLFDLKLENVSSDNPIKVSLSARFPGGKGQNLNLKGSIGPLGRSLNINHLSIDIILTLKEISFAEFVPYLPKNLPFYPESGVISMDLDLNGNTASGVTSQAEIGCKELILAWGGGKNRTANINVHLQEKMKIEWETGGVELDTLEIRLNENTLSLKGKVQGLKVIPQWDLTMRSKGLKPSSLIEVYPPAHSFLPSNISLSGPVDLEIVSKGDMDKFQASGSLEMKDLEITFGDIFRKSSAIPFQVSFNVSKTGDTIHLEPLLVNLHNLSLRTTGEIFGLSAPHFGLLIHTNDVSLQGWAALIPRLSNYQPEGIFIVRSSLKGALDNISLNLQFLSSSLSFQIPHDSDAAKRVKSSMASLESLEMEVQAKRIKKELKGAGRIEVKKGEYQSVAFEKMQARFEYQNDLLNIQGLQVYACQGDISLSGVMDTKKNRLSLNPIVKNVDVGKLVDSLTEYKGLFDGIFSGSFALNSPSKTGQKGTMDGSGTFRLAKGELRNFNLVETTLDALFGLKGISRFLERQKGELQQHKITRFDSLDGDFSMIGHQVLLSKVSLHNIHTSKATDSDAILDGMIVLDSKTLDLKGKIILSPRDSMDLAKQAEPLEALLNPEGRMVLPISVTGSFEKPMPFLDTQYVLSAMARYYGKKEIQKGLDKLGEELGLPKKGPRDQTETPRPVEELLKELFKK